MIVLAAAELPPTNRTLPNGTVKIWFAANALTEVSVTFDSSGQQIAVEKSTYGLAPCPLKEYACRANVFGTHITPMKLAATHTVVFPSAHSWAQYSGSGSVCGYVPSCTTALSTYGDLGPYVSPPWIKKMLASHELREVGLQGKMNGQDAVRVVARTSPTSTTWIDPKNDEILSSQALPYTITWNFEWFTGTADNSRHLDLVIPSGYHQVASRYAETGPFVTTLP